MPNEEHLHIPQRGAAAWNVWRQEHADAVPDLSDTHLPKANLSGANLSGANLSGARCHWPSCAAPACPTS